MQLDKMETPKKKIDAQLIKKLWSGDSGQALSALKELRSAGNCNYMPELLKLLNETHSEEIRKELALFLSDIRDKGCIPFIIDSLNDDSYQPVKNIIVSSCWQSRLDYSKHIDTFINIFIKEDYLTALEAFTVIEESLLDIPGEKIKEYRSRLITSIEDIDNEKKPLLRELINLMVA
jgi:hypothetical protein